MKLEVNRGQRPARQCTVLCTWPLGRFYSAVLLQCYLDSIVAVISAVGGSSRRVRGCELPTSKSSLTLIAPSDILAWDWALFDIIHGDIIVCSISLLLVF